jgi:solute carrier family 13 (sodium-dependent dicarboxylate transporter), member 2/3/5
VTVAFGPRQDAPRPYHGPPPQLGFATEPDRAGRRARIARSLWPVAAIAVYFLVPVGPDALTEGGRATTAVAVPMAVWWVGETLPLAVTSLLPIVLLPLTGALGLSATTTAYGNPLVFLFLGGFVLALAMQRWGLHRRIALLTIRAVGTEPRMMVGGFMLATAGLSMWVSNTATTVMMLPIGVSVLALVATRLGGEEHGLVEGMGRTSDPAAAVQADVGPASRSRSAAPRRTWPSASCSGSPTPPASDPLAR